MLKPASAPPRSYGHRFQLAEGTSPGGLICHCVHKAVSFLFPAAHLRSCLSPAATAPPLPPPPLLSAAAAALFLPRASCLQANSSREIARMQTGQCGNQEAYRDFFAAGAGRPRYRCEGQLLRVQMKLLTFTLLRYTSAEQGRRRPTPRFLAAGASGVTSVETCAGAAA
jgi:hypothetical protein